MQHEHHKRRAPHIHEISIKLQSEVDLILSKVNEKQLFAEFREDEVFTIQNNDTHEQIVVHDTIDERILLSRQPQNMRPKNWAKMERTLNARKDNVGGITKLVNYLFKPLPY